MIVYTRLQAHTKATGFKWYPDHKKWIGNIIANEWRANGGSMDDLGVVMSEEENGTWMVYEYPDTFTETIDREIAKYADKLLTPKSIKPPIPPPKRKRKRIPHFSGKKFNK